jgi:uncharacterized spore protein YtfJ
VRRVRVGVLRAERCIGAGVGAGAGVGVLSSDEGEDHGCGCGCGCGTELVVLKVVVGKGLVVLLVTVICDSFSFP